MNKSYYIGKTWFNRTIGDVKNDLANKFDLERASLRLRIKDKRFDFLNDTKTLKFYLGNNFSPEINVLDGNITFDLIIADSCIKKGINRKSFKITTNPVKMTLKNLELMLSQVLDPLIVKSKVGWAFDKSFYHADSTLEEIGVENGDKVYFKKY